MEARSATRTGMPCRRASPAVCSPMHRPRVRLKSASGPRAAIRPRTVEAEVKAMKSKRPSSSSRRSSWERAVLQTVR